MADGSQALDASVPPSRTSVAKRLLSELPGLKRMGAADAEERSHPLFPCVALLLLQECLNRRLFSTVRERKRLTYDANFHLTSFETIQGGWYLVTVTAKPELAEQVRFLHPWMEARCCSAAFAEEKVHLTCVGDRGLLCPGHSALSSRQTPSTPIRHLKLSRTKTHSMNTGP